MTGFRGLHSKRKLEPLTLSWRIFENKMPIVQLLDRGRAAGNTTTISDKIKWDTFPYGREKAVSSPFNPFQCGSCVVKIFNIHVDLQH